MPIIVLVTGEAGSGKDYFAERLSAKLRQRLNLVFISRLADPIYKIAEVILGEEVVEKYSDRDLKEEIIPRINMSLRELLQKIGTEFIRNMIDEDYFVKEVIFKSRRYPSDIIIVPDCRFMNEYQEFKKEFKNVIVVNIVGDRFRLEQNRRCHTSELGYKEIPADYTINNTYEPNCMDNNIIEIVEYINLLQTNRK